MKKVLGAGKNVFSRGGCSRHLVSHRYKMLFARVGNATAPKNPFSGKSICRSGSVVTPAPFVGAGYLLTLP